MLPLDHRQTVREEDAVWWPGKNGREWRVFREAMFEPSIGTTRARVFQHRIGRLDTSDFRVGTKLVQPRDIAPCPWTDLEEPSPTPVGRELAQSLISTE